MSEPVARQNLSADRPASPAHAAGGVPEPVLADDTRLAIRVREHVRHGDVEQARAHFAGLVEAHQRRALRLAYHYLRDSADAEDAVQDAFVKAYSHLATYREAWPFGVWFTRILINGCIDRQKRRLRRARWFALAPSPDDIERSGPAFGGAPVDDPEATLLARERWTRLAGAVGRLRGRQRTVFLLCHFGDWTPREVGAMMGLTESTVRVHLFRAAHRLRSLLGGRS
jgi:RNA polymerase sigma-70 factor (ECF subfamily)